MKLFKKYYYGDYDSMNPASPNPSKEGLSNAQPLPVEDAAKKVSSSKSEALSDGQSPFWGVGGPEWPLWEIFIRSKQGLDHKHVGSLHAADAQMAIENARDVYTRRQEGVSLWVVESHYIHASNPDDAESFYEPANDKVYRHPTFYDLPDEVNHM